MTPKESNPLDAYIAAFPKTTQAILQKIRATIRKALPGVEEKVSYGVAAFKKGGTYVIYMGGYPKHVAVYPVYKGDPAMGEALRPYSSGTATAKFMLDKPIPYALITKIVKAKVKENAERVAAKAAKIKMPKKVMKKVVKKSVKKSVVKTKKK